MNNERVFASSIGVMQVMDISTNRVIWTRRTGGVRYWTQSPDRRHLLAPMSYPQPSLLIRAEDGEIVKERQFDRSENHFGFASVDGRWIIEGRNDAFAMVRNAKGHDHWIYCRAHGGFFFGGAFLGNSACAIVLWGGHIDLIDVLGRKRLATHRVDLGDGYEEWGPDWCIGQSPEARRIAVLDSESRQVLIFGY